MASPILLVEDDPDIRESLAALLEEEGYAVVPAANGAEALVRLRSMARPGLVLLDLMMPVMDGRTFLERVREDAALATLPVIVLTADTRPAPAGVAAVLGKPFALGALLQHVARHLEP